MKFKNKVVAAVSATIMTAGMVMSSVPAFAGSEEMDFINSYNGTAREIAQYVIGEGCTIEEATEIMDIYLKGEAELEGDNSGISTYADGDTSTEELPKYYSDINLAQTEHYILIIATDCVYPQEEVNFRFNGSTTNVIVPNDNSYRKCFSYSSKEFDISTSLSYSSSDNRKWTYNMYIQEVPNLSDVTTAQPLIAFPIEKGSRTSTEFELNKNIEFSYYSKTGDNAFAFETFALGDVNHDGSVTNADSTLLLRYLNKTQPDFKLDYKDGSNHYSAVTNFVAADFDKNNKINLADVIYINKNLDK
ncbi:MAG: hypothetical protein IJZ64_07025 [Ruminococcus sp.]|nr:hypothetical protein [Ruminococcus sp.]